jgi:hypothetical protein
VHNVNHKKNTTENVTIGRLTVSSPAGRHADLSCLYRRAAFCVEAR